VEVQHVGGCVEPSKGGPVRSCFSFDVRKTGEDEFPHTCMFGGFNQVLDVTHISFRQKPFRQRCKQHTPKVHDAVYAGTSLRQSFGLRKIHFAHRNIGVTRKVRWQWRLMQRQTQLVRTRKQMPGHAGTQVARRSRDKDVHAIFSKRAMKFGK